MSTPGFDDLGPRIDLGHEPDLEDHHRATGAPPFMEPARDSGGYEAETYDNQAYGGGYNGGRRGGGFLSLLALILSVVALLLAGWSLLTTPEPLGGPPMSSNVVPGGTGERVAKLEKDVSDMMLRMVSLEDEIKTVRSRAGAVNKVAELSAQVQALQGRVENLNGRSPAAAPPAPRQESAPAAQAKPDAPAPRQEAAPAKSTARPQVKKMVYTVRKGDTLFTVAQRYKVSLQDLSRWNNLGPKSVIKVGQDLVIYK
ncbi:MAG: LysM peptidoglycan-binding domain-containing protein [Deltaproteobacteria bacterium]|nr:LysM peptidoglycan-binding domain-containing protein [Deltaproteobacteria bacterium]